MHQGTASRLGDSRRRRPGTSPATGPGWRDRAGRWTGFHLDGPLGFADRATGEEVLARGPLYRCARNEGVVRALTVDLRERISYDFDRELTALDVPVLIIHGAEDHNLDAAERLARSLPRPTLRILPRTGHVPWLEDSAGVRDALRRFLSDIET